MTSDNIPGFLCIGAQKAATTWLQRNLRHHPEVWMPPVKELHHFNLPDKTPFIFFRGQRSLKGSIVKVARQNWRRDPLWTLRYLLLWRTDGWYRSLFRPAPGQISGEITPDYAPLDLPTITRVHALTPRARILYILRDPVDRVWSHVKMWTHLHQQPHVDQLSAAEIERIITTRMVYTFEHCDYVGNLARWEQLFHRDQIWIGFYDEVAADPAAFLKEAWAALGLTVDDRWLPAQVAQRQSHFPSEPMPAATRRWLSARLHPQLCALHQRFDNAHTAQWLQTAEQHLA